jgi:hypothetical protein
MNQTLTPHQISDLAAIRKICDEMGTDVVVIGATALLLSIGDLGRFTRDIDLTVALDLSEFRLLIQRLLATGWKQPLRLEHRWAGPSEFSTARSTHFRLGSKADSLP